MTLSEYEFRMESYELKEIDKQFDLAIQAWFNAQVQATDKDGKLIYHKFDQFFDYVEKVNKVRESYEPNYKPIKRIIRPSKQDILINRIKEFKKLHPRKAVEK